METSSNRKKKVSIDTYCKALVAVVMVHGMLLSAASYVLSFLDKEPVAEVSTVVVTELVAPVVTYLLTNMIANIFEKNKLSFSTPLTHAWMMNKSADKNYVNKSKGDEEDE